jgi:hypothetical protein
MEAACCKFAAKRRKSVLHQQGSPDNLAFSEGRVAFWQWFACWCYFRATAPADHTNGAE